MTANLFGLIHWFKLMLFVLCRTSVWFCKRKQKPNEQLTSIEFFVMSITTKKSMFVLIECGTQPRKQICLHLMADQRTELLSIFGFQIFKFLCNGHSYLINKKSHMILRQRTTMSRSAVKEAIRNECVKKAFFLQPHSD